MKYSNIVSFTIFSLKLFVGLSNSFSSLLRGGYSTELSTDSNPDIRVLSLYGSHEEMGNKYGEYLKNELHEVLSIIENYYIIQNNVSYTALVNQAQFFHERYSFSYENFLKGIASGADLTLDECKILNGMETLGHVLAVSDLGQCAFLYTPPTKTYSGSSIIGRNYDYGEPFDQCSKYLVVTILNENNMVPTAIIGMPGQIYCPSCVNQEGIFMELNNGSPSGGGELAFYRKSMLINMLEFVQNSNYISRLNHAMYASESDYSLIVNTATKNSTLSFELSSTLGQKTFYPNQSDYFVSTNFYQNTSWDNIPEATDNSTWMGVTRRNNLLTLLNMLTVHNISTIKNVMNVTLENGGALWDLTIYQMILDTYTMTLYLRSPKYQHEWKEIYLNNYFSKDNSESNNCEENKIQFETATISAAIGAVISGIGVGCAFFAYKKYKDKQHIYQEVDVDRNSLLGNRV